MIYLLAHLWPSIIAALVAGVVIGWNIDRHAA